MSARRRQVTSRQTSRCPEELGAVVFEKASPAARVERIKTATVHLLAAPRPRSIAKLQRSKDRLC